MSYQFGLIPLPKRSSLLLDDNDVFLDGTENSDSTHVIGKETTRTPPNQPLSLKELSGIYIKRTSSRGWESLPPLLIDYLESNCFSFKNLTELYAHLHNDCPHYRILCGFQTQRHVPQCGRDLTLSEYLTHRDEHSFDTPSVYSTPESYPLFPNHCSMCSHAFPTATALSSHLCESTYPPRKLTEPPAKIMGSSPPRLNRLNNPLKHSPMRPYSRGRGQAISCPGCKLELSSVSDWDPHSRSCEVQQELEWDEDVVDFFQKLRKRVDPTADRYRIYSGLFTHR